MLPYFRLAKRVLQVYNTCVSSIQIYTGGSVGCNAYLIRCAEDYVLVDAPAGVAAWVARRLPEGARLAHLLITHQHFDHVEGAAEVQERFGCTVHAHSPYSTALTLEEYASGWGLPRVKPYRVDDAFGSGKSRAVWGGDEWEIFCIPGHSADGVAYLLKREESVFVGDILFAGSVGRTDFPGGSMAGLVNGIRTHLTTLDPHTEVFSGHGPSTTIGEELLNNPYIS